jgi:hypothetical protein
LPPHLGPDQVYNNITKTLSTKKALHDYKTMRGDREPSQKDTKLLQIQKKDHSWSWQKTATQKHNKKPGQQY